MSEYVAKEQRGHTHPLSVRCQSNTKSVLASSQKVVESDAFAEWLLIQLCGLEVAIFSASLISPASSRTGGLQIFDRLVVGHFHAHSAGKKVGEIDPGLNGILDRKKRGAHGFHVLGHVIVVVSVVLHHTCGGGSGGGEERGGVWRCGRGRGRPHR